jgi:hypothetical protein
MAFLFTADFAATGDGQPHHGGTEMLVKIKNALKSLTGKDGKPGKKRDPVGYERDGLDYPVPPVKLRQDRDFLKDEWRSIWKNCTIEFDGDEAGASIHIPTSRIRIGPFFLQGRFGVKDFEKIIIHEFLHAAFIFEFRDAHHGMMEQVLIHNLHYTPPANPAELD